MSDLRRIVKEIEKKKDLEINLPKYFNVMMSAYHRYSRIRLVMNYYTCKEMLREEGEIPKEIRELALRLEYILEKQILEDSLPEQLEEGIKEIHSIRSSITDAMTILTTFTDSLQIFEYALNRVEYRFSREGFPAGYDDETFLIKMMEYVTGDRDNVVINGKIGEMVGQLPIRMTKSRFFEIIRDSFSLYKGAEKSAVSDFIYMLRTVGMLEKPGSKGESFPELADILSRLEQADYDAITEEAFRDYEDKLSFAAACIKRFTDLYLMLQEVVNDSYVVLLSMPYALTDAEEGELCRKILKLSLRDGDRKEEENGRLLELFEGLEGKQEHFYEQLSAYDYLLDALEDSEALLKSLMLEKIYHILQRMAKLTSSSLFINLDQKESREQADESYINKVRDSYTEELGRAFQSHSRLVNRSVMAATLKSLPVFFNNLDELKEYMAQSLMNCKDEKEKLAAVKLIEKIMTED